MTDEETFISGVARNLGRLDSQVENLSTRIKRLEDNFDKLLLKTIDKIFDDVDHPRQSLPKSDVEPKG